MSTFSENMNSIIDDIELQNVYDKMILKNRFLIKSLPHFQKTIF